MKNEKMEITLIRGYETEAIVSKQIFYKNKIKLKK